MIKKAPTTANLIYKLTVLLDNKKGGDFIFVYPNLVGAEILRTIEQSHYIDKRYLFWCAKKPKRWVLHRWEELPTKLESHEQIS